MGSGIRADRVIVSSRSRRGMAGVVRLGAARLGTGSSRGHSGAFGASACNWAGRWFGNGFDSSGYARPLGVRVVGKGYVGGIRSRMMHGTPSLGKSGGSMVSQPSSTGSESRPVTALFFPGKYLRFRNETPISLY